jgi:hypothetical protein
MLFRNGSKPILKIITKSLIKATYGPFLPENNPILSIVTVAEIRAITAKNN